MRIIKFSVLLVLLSLGFNMPSAFAGGSFWNVNDFPVSNTLAYFDLRDRETMVQVTNTSSTDPVTIHVQIFADAFNCGDRNFTDSLTPNETHVYDIRNLVRAIGTPVNFQIPDGSHGFVAISASDVAATPPEAQPSIISNFRIIDDSGYEYRVNSAGNPVLLTDEALELVARFTDNWGANRSDIVGTRVFNSAGLPDGTLDFTLQITDPYALSIFDDEETPNSCAQVTFGCDEFPGDDDAISIGDIADLDGDLPNFTSEFINQGINEVFTNSRDGAVLCAGDLNTDGYISLTPPVTDTIDFVGYIGLNDGAGRGSMDRFGVVQEAGAEDPGPQG